MILSDSPYSTISAGDASVTRDSRTVGRDAQQLEVELELAQQRAFGQRAARRGQQRRGQQVDGRDRGRRVDAAHDATRASSSTSALTAGRRVSSSKRCSRQFGRCVSSRSLSRMGSPTFTCTVPKRSRSTRSDAQQVEPALLLLRRARQLRDVGVGLDDALVAEIHRHEHHRPHRVAQEAAHRHRQHAGLRVQQPAGARAAAFDEVLDGVAARHDGGQVLHEHHGVERVAGEACGG